MASVTHRLKPAQWITVWWPECELRAVPQIVPEGWTFQIYSPGEAPVQEDDLALADKPARYTIRRRKQGTGARG